MKDSRSRSSSSRSSSRSRSSTLSNADLVTMMRLLQDHVEAVDSLVATTTALLNYVVARTTPDLDLKPPRPREG